jgi:hypothetical protein
MFTSLKVLVRYTTLNSGADPLLRPLPEEEGSGPETASRNGDAHPPADEAEKLMPITPSQRNGGRVGKSSPGFDVRLISLDGRNHLLAQELQGAHRGGM